MEGEGTLRWVGGCWEGDRECWGVKRLYEDDVKMI